MDLNWKLEITIQNPMLFLHYEQQKLSCLHTVSIHFIFNRFGFNLSPIRRWDCVLKWKQFINSQRLITQYMSCHPIMLKPRTTSMSYCQIMLKPRTTSMSSLLSMLKPRTTGMSSLLSMLKPRTTSMSSLPSMLKPRTTGPHDKNTNINGKLKIHIVQT